MLIFIDESGSVGEIGVGASIFTVGALILPEGKWEKLRKAYGRIRPRLPQEKGEVKGRKLNEAQAAEILQLLRRHEALFEATVIDLGIHTAEIVALHQARQAEGMTSNLTDEHHPNVVEAIWKARRQLEGFKPPYYIQAILTFLLIRNVLTIAPNYYAQRRPHELAAFHWVIDAKGTDETPTTWETWWSTFIMPWMQTELIHKPIGWYRDANFRHMERFETEPTQFFSSLLPSNFDGTRPKPLNLQMILGESFRFSYKVEPGLELADIVTTTLRRALRGHMRPGGWRHLRDLLVNRRGENIHLLAFNGAANPAKRLPYNDVMKAFRNSPRSMVAKRSRLDD